MKHWLITYLLLVFVQQLNAQNCFDSSEASMIDDCGNCVYENDSLANICDDTETVCAGDTLNVYISNVPIVSSISSVFSEVIRAQIETDFCADGGNIIDCYCNLLPELESIIVEHSFLQNGNNNNSQLMDLLSFEDDYLRLIIHVADETEAGELVYKIDLERDVIMNCYLCNDQVCIDQNIGIPILEEHEITFNISNDCEDESAVQTSNSTLNEETLSVSPNPTTNFIQLSNIESEFKVSIFDVNGRLCKKLQNEKILDVTDLKSGIYFISVNGKSINAKTSFVKL